MIKGNMTREQAVARVGEQAVARVERENCEYTDRIMDNGLAEFAAHVPVGDDILIAYYYQTQEAIDAAGDLDQLGWDVEGYEVV